MNPDDPQTLAALKAALAAQAETIGVLKWALGGVTFALVSVSGFFVAWIRGLYDQRTTDNDKELEARDALLERVLTAVGQLAEAQKAAARGRS